MNTTTGITTKPLTYVTADGREFTDPVEATLQGMRK